MLGEKDDWTPPAYCVRLADAARAKQPPNDVTLKMYADSYHGFDSARSVRFRTDVPNGVNKAGVHQGGNPVAKAESQKELDAFLARIFRSHPGEATALASPFKGEDGRGMGLPALSDPPEGK